MSDPHRAVRDIALKVNTRAVPPKVAVQVLQRAAVNQAAPDRMRILNAMTRTVSITDQLPTLVRYKAL